MNTTLTQLEAFKSGDGAHCGLTDWYPDKEIALQEALNNKIDFTTGWYASKKEIASANITAVNDEISIEVSVSDDFDTIGCCCEQIPHTTDLELIRTAIYKIWDGARSNQKENQVYTGYVLFHWSDEIPEWHNDSRDRYPEKVKQCLDYYIVNTGGMWDILDSPPGDNYHWWGWSNDEETEGQTCREEGIPEDVAEKLADHATSLGKGLRIGDWEIEPWEED